MHNNTTFVTHLYSLSEITQIVDGKLHGEGSVTITHLSPDTRKIWQPNACLFFALKTSRNNGHNYLSQAQKIGIAAVVVSEIPKEDVNYILVEDSLTALQKLAAHHRSKFNIPTVAITGSNGKTIVKEWISHIAQHNFKICKSPKSYNSQIGVPLSLWQLDETYNLSIFEAGISMPKEMKKLALIIRPSIGVFTHLGDAHSANFSTDQERLNEKLELFKECDTIVCSSNQPEVISAIKALGKNTLTWGSNMSCDLHIMRNMDGAFTLTYNGESHSIKLSQSDKASIENTFTSIASCLALKMNIVAVLERVKSLPKIDLRLQQVDGLYNNDLILDYYNADYQSTTIALDFLSQQNTKDKTVVIISDILQSNIEDKELYSRINILLQNHNVSSVVGIGERISKTQGAFKIPGMFYKNTQEFLLKHPLHEIQNSAILLKGAREFEFEKIAERLRVKTHQTSLEVNLTRLKHNLNVVKTAVGPQTKIVAMVKALGYGSGGYQIAKLLENNNISYLGVAYTDEATELRSAGLSLPIMVLNPDLNDLTPYIEQNIEPVIYSFDSLEKVMGKGVNVHLELDTGMHRLGFVKEDIPILIQKLNEPQAPTLVSIFSHLATSDDETKDAFTALQIDSFKTLSEEIEAELGIKVLKHISNSAGIERFPNARFDMVRLGIGLYGISASNMDTQLKPVSTFKSYITQIRTVKADEGIGYGQHDKSSKDRKIAVVALGYADGYNRQFSQGKGSFYIKNKEAKVVGNVCMDMTMCDVTNVDCKVGDQVIIFGDNPKVEDVAKQIGTIPYEILTNVSERVNRVFYQE